MTKVTIDRELLEDLRDAANDCLNHEIMRGNDRNVPAYTELVEQADMALAAPRQPEGEAASILLPALRQYMHNDGSGLLAGYEYERTQQIVAELREECERLRVKLMTIASAEPGRHNIEWAKAMAATGNSEAYAKWRAAFDQRDKLAGLLRAAYEQGRYRRLSDDELAQIKAALAEV